MLIPKQGANTYKETRIKTASQARLIIMLYDEALKQIDNVLAMYDKGITVSDYATINTALNKALDIVGELSASLDFEQGGEIALNLYRLYIFFSNEITASNIQKKPANLKRVHLLLEELRDTWNTIDNNTQPDPTTRAVNIAS